MLPPYTATAGPPAPEEPVTPVVDGDSGRRPAFERVIRRGAAWDRAEWRRGCATRDGPQRRDDSASANTGVE